MFRDVDIFYGFWIRWTVQNKQQLKSHTVFFWCLHFHIRSDFTLSVGVNRPPGVSRITARLLLPLVFFSRFLDLSAPPPLPLLFFLGEMGAKSLLLLLGVDRAAPPSLNPFFNHDVTIDSTVTVTSCSFSSLRQWPLNPDLLWCACPVYIGQSLPPDALGGLTAIPSTRYSQFNPGWSVFEVSVGSVFSAAAYKFIRVLVLQIRPFKEVNYLESTPQVKSERFKMNKWWKGKCVSGSLQ